MASDLPPQRLAMPADATAISALMRASVTEIFPLFYDARQTASAVIHIAHLDQMLIDDRTYFVHEADGEIVACGGWSRRAKVFSATGEHDDDARRIDPRTEPARVRAMFVRADWTRRGIGRALLLSCENAARAEGFAALTLGSTRPGAPLYRSFGFQDTETLVVTMPDGVTIDVIAMDRAITPA